MLHENNWRESLHVLEFHHPSNFPWILAATPGFQSTTGRSVPSWIPFYWVLGFHWDWLSSGRPDLSSTVVDTCTGEMSLSIRSSRSRVLVSLTLGDKDELEEDDEEWLSCLESVLDVDESDPEDEFVDKPGTTIGTKFLRVAWNPNPVFNEMWFLTIDPFIRISVFIAKLSERQHCWRVFEDFHSQEFFQFFDIHRCLFLRLHFTIGGYDYRRTTRLRQSIHFSFAQVLFADHVHWRTGVHNKLSFLRFQRWCKVAPIFRRREECCSFMLF